MLEAENDNKILAKLLPVAIMPIERRLLLSVNLVSRSGHRFAPHPRQRADDRLSGVGN